MSKVALSESDLKILITYFEAPYQSDSSYIWGIPKSGNLNPRKVEVEVNLPVLVSEDKDSPYLFVGFGDQSVGDSSPNPQTQNHYIVGFDSQDLKIDGPNFEIYTANAF